MSLSVFQFTPLCERLRTALIWFVLCSSYFNSRLSARGYHGQEDIYAETYYFNSRLSARGYSNVDYGSLAEGEFQFTPLCERLQQKQTIYSCISAQFLFNQFTLLYSFNYSLIKQQSSLHLYNFILRQSPEVLCMGYIRASSQNSNGSPASTFSFFPIESILL